MSKKLKAKYAIEEMVSSVSLYYNLLTSDSLRDEDVKKEIKQHNYHHYLILKRPRILLTNVEFQEKNIKYDFCIKGNQDKSISILAPVDPNFVKGLSCKIYDNGASFDILRNGKRITAYNRSTLLFDDVCRYVSQKYPESYFKVMYVGQSYGNKFKRDAYDRLMQHGTLQQILSDVVSKDFNSEIFILFVEFDLNLFYISAMGAPTKDATIGLDESMKKCSERRAVPIPEKEKITYIEASMIKWFEPEYNVEYKKAFPKKNQSSYASIYTQDLNNVCFEIDLMRSNIYLFSDKQPASNYIMGRFPLDKNRKDMFSIPVD